MKIFFIPSWRSMAMSLIESAPGDHPAHQRSDFPDGVGTFFSREAQPVIGEAAKTGFSASRMIGRRPGTDTRFWSSNEATAVQVV